MGFSREITGFKWTHTKTHTTGWEWLTVNLFTHVEATSFKDLQGDLASREPGKQILEYHHLNPWIWDPRDQVVPPQPQTSRQPGQEELEFQTAPARTFLPGGRGGKGAPGSMGAAGSWHVSSEQRSYCFPLGNPNALSLRTALLFLGDIFVYREWWLSNNQNICPLGSAGESPNSFM